MLCVEIYDVLREVNVYVEELRYFGEADVTEHEYIAVCNQLNKYIGVGGFTSDAATGNVMYNFQTKESNGSIKNQSLPSTSKHVEPLCYPLLFPYGEEGWSIDVRSEVDFMEYLCSRILLPEPNLVVVNNGGYSIPVSRFRCFSRLTQYYVVECVSRAVNWRAKWHMQNQSKRFGQNWSRESIFNYYNDFLSFFWSL
jgi:hypothetical protein